MMTLKEAAATRKPFVDYGRVIDLDYPLEYFYISPSGRVNKVWEVRVSDGAKERIAEIVDDEITGPRFFKSVETGINMFSEDDNG